MADSKIKINIECQNIAPLEKLQREFNLGSLKIGIFANNGCGKTFISRLFRLIDHSNENLKLDMNGCCPTDSLIRFNCNFGHFAFKITNKEGAVIEDISFDIKEKNIPILPNSHYLYHVFNQDYVEENIRVLNYEKDSDIQGYILGKANIDLTDDENKLKKIQDDGVVLREQIARTIQSYLIKNIDSIRDIKRLQEYKDLLNIEAILNSINQEKCSCYKTVDELITDYNKVKSIPENLEDIPLIDNVSIDTDFIQTIVSDLNKQYNLSSFADEFKAKIKSKQNFIEEGVRLFKDNHCPFCEQELSSNSLALIDKYTRFLTDSESQTIKQFQSYSKQLQNLIFLLSNVENTVNQRANLFNEYKTKYIPTLENEYLDTIAIISSIKDCIQNVLDATNKKIEAINSSIQINDDVIQNIKKHVLTLNDLIESNNNKIQTINHKKNKIGEENKNIRKAICKSTYIHLAEICNKDILKIHELRKEYKKLNDDISKRKEAEKVSKKKKVYETIKEVLDYFFSGKYTLKEDDFHLILNNTTLNKGQVKRVLSEGEKNIIAFAYYLGDVHLKIEKEDDYKKLFFVIDDPISSMDFTYVYTMSGVIRDIKQILKKIDRERFIILTHNNDFMRILCANNIVDKKLLLRNSELIDFNENFTVPYISHLIDVYRIARKGEKANHTTANSIRHIIETLTKFQNIEVSNDSIAEYIKDNIPNDKKSYTFINDLSHGGWRNEQAPLTDEDYKEVCETIITHIEKLFPKQIKYCEKF